MTTTTLRPLDNPNATLAAVAADPPPGWFGDYNEILRETTMRMHHPFGAIMPIVTLRVESAHHVSQRWSAWCDEFHCGWYGATPREALLTVVTNWHARYHAYALERVRRMTAAMHSLEDVL